MPTVNTTRDRIRAARDEFRAGLTSEQQPAEPQQAPQTPEQQQPAPATQFAPVSDVAAATAPLYAQPLQYQADAQELAYRRNENEQLRREIDAMRAQQAELAAASKHAQEELDRYKEDQELREYFSGNGDYGGLSPDDARKLMTPVLKTMRQERDDLRKQMAATQESVNQRFSNYAMQQQQQAQQRVYDAVLKAHPDLQELQRHPAYAQMMASAAAPGSSVTVGQLVSGELAQGNAGYAINVLNEIKRRMKGDGGNGLASVASVGSTAPASAPIQQNPAGDGLSYDDMAELRFKLQTRQITRDQFRERLAKHREASKAS